MANEILLNCSILGSDVERVFPVKIPRDYTVGQLKKAIKEERATKLAHIDAADIDIWKVRDPA